MRRESHRTLQIERLEARIALASVQVAGNTMRIVGTDAADVYAFVHDSTKPVRVNNISYAVPATVTRIVFSGGGGQDSITAWTSGYAELRPGAARLFNAASTAQPAREVVVETTESIKVYGAPGQAVRFYDAAGVDTFADRDAYARMFGTGYDNVAYGFANVTALSDGNPNDVAWFYNLTGAHVFSSRETTARSFSAVHDSTAFGFSKVYARSLAGEGDLAEMHGGAGDDRFLGKPGESRLIGPNFHHVAYDFEKVVARGGVAGNDVAELTGTTGNDELVTWPIFSRLTGSGYSIEAKAFDAVFAQAGEGYDIATLNDGETSDEVESKANTTSLTGGGVRNVAAGFEGFTVRAGRGGVDRAWLTATGGDDNFTGSGASGQLASPVRTLALSGLAEVNLVYPAETHPAPTPQGLSYQLNVEARPASDPLALGRGVAYPWKLLTDPANPGQVLAITGEGEQGGASFLYRLDRTTLQVIGVPLYVGSSASDIAWVGSQLVITARNSGDVILVDPVAWRVLTGALVFQDPIAVTAIGANRFAVVSIRVKELKVYRIEGSALVWERTIPLPGIAYDVQYDATYNRLYVTQPSLHAIIEVNVATGAVTRQHDVGGEPSYGGAIMGRYFIAANRDGYIDFIERATGARHQLDLHGPLGLDRATTALRAIDPTDIIVLDDRNLVVVNNRQDSVLLGFDSQAVYQAPVARARFSGGAFGVGAVYYPGPGFASPENGFPTVISGSGDTGPGTLTAELLITTPAIHRIERVRLVETAGQVAVSSQRFTIGVTPISAIRLGQGLQATMAVVTSEHKLHLISEFTGSDLTFTSIGGYEISAWNPIAADEYGRLWMIANKLEIGGTFKQHLIAVTARGQVVHDFVIALTSPYSMTAAHDTVVVVDRTRQQIVTVDVPTAAIETITLPNERPRHAEILARGEWLVIHDTNPHIGVTHSKNGIRTFTPYTGSGVRWLASSAIDDAGRPILLDFNGRVMTYDVTQRKYTPWLTLPTEPATVAKFGAGRLWVVSPIDSTVAIIRSGAMSPEAIWTDARAFDVIPAEGGAWLVTTAGLVWRAL